MKICFLSQEYPPETHIGGIGTYTYNMASALSKFGHEVHVITATQYSEETVFENEVRVHRIKKRHVRPTELSQFLYSNLVARKISEIDCGFDVVQASEYASEAFWHSFKKKSPLITRLATPFFWVKALNGNMFAGPRPFFNLMEKMQTLKSDGIFSSTAALAKVVTAKWGIQSSRVSVIPNSIDLGRVRQLGDNTPIPHMLQGEVFLVYFGRLEKRKGVSILARALPPVFEEFPYLRMVFVGSDAGYDGIPMREYIKETLGKYNERLIFYDNQPHEKLFPIVKAAKMVILPSLWEAFGFVCVEAMALGRPVIASSGSGFEEIIEDKVSGFLVEPGNSEILARNIIACLKDEAGLGRISKNAAKRAEDFEVSKVAVKLLDYYSKIIAEWKIRRSY